MSPVNVADSVQFLREVIVSENDKTREELPRTFTDILDLRLVTFLGDNLSHLKNEMGTSRETQQQQYKDIISKIQKHIQPLHSEMAASHETIEGQCREILAKLQEQDERLAAVVESIKSKQEESAPPKDGKNNNNKDDSDFEQSLKVELAADSSSGACGEVRAAASEQPTILSVAKSVTASFSNGM